MSDELYEEVARVYLATEDGKPTAMIEKWFGVPRSTACRWIATARRRGLLEPTIPGKGARRIVKRCPHCRGVIP